MTTDPSSVLDRLALFTAQAPDWSPHQVCEQLHRVGLRRVEWAAHYPPGDLPLGRPWHLDLTPDTGNLAQLRDLGQEFGLDVVCLSGPQTVRNDEGPQRLLNAADALDCRTVRLGVHGFHEEYPGREACRQAAAALGRWVPQARERQIKLLIETHADSISCSPELAQRVVEEFDPDAVGVILDPGNMVVEGMTGWKLAVSLLGDYLAHVHVKNLGWFRQPESAWRFEYTSLAGGMVDWPAVVRVLEAAGYRGTYSFEDFRGGYCRLPQGITTADKLAEDVHYLARVLATETAALMESA